jgi:trk system potassium uptake protein TrkA
MMKIIIVGAGAVGLHLARTLSWEEHKVVIIDHRQDLVDLASSSMDVLALRGSGTSISTLVLAGAQGADLLLAVTNVDEVNIVACMLARELGVRTRIARIRNQEYSQRNSPVPLKSLGIDHVIHPELEAAQEVINLIKYPDAIDVVECAGGKMFLIGVNLDSTSPILNRPLRELNPDDHEIPFRVVAIGRDTQTLIPTGNDKLMAGDLIYVITRMEDIPRVFSVVGKPIEPARKVMIFGGGIIGRMVAEELEAEKKYITKLIESDPEKSDRAVNRLLTTMVVRGAGGIDIDLLAIEGLGEMDVFAALTDDDENNIVTSLFSRHLMVRRTITLISKPQYMPIMQAIGLGASINERLLTTQAILRFLRGGRIMAVSSLRGLKAEIIEYQIGDHSKVAGKRLAEVDFPPGSLIGAIEHSGEIGVAVGHSRFMPGDRVVVFCLEKAMQKMEKIFS